MSAANLYEFANPVRFERVAARVFPFATAAAILFAISGLYFALFNSPADYQQGETVRIMYVHVPAAWMALFCYSAMAASSAAGFIWKHPLADVAAKESAPIGAVFTFLALFTGSLWGKPMWGAWWAWDARLTSVLILFFLYLGYMALWRAVPDKTRAAKLAAILAIVGFVNIPIIKFSVDWWNSLHQPASIMRAGGVSVHSTMLTPLFLMIAAYVCIYVAMLLAAMGNELTARRLARVETADGNAPARIVEQ